MRRVCGECGGNITSTDVKGQTFPWKDFPEVPIMSSFMARKCAQCDSMILNGMESEGLDKILEETIRTKTSEFIRIIKLNTEATQRELAKKVGISPEYLSELVSERKTPGLSLFNLLKVLSLIPNSSHCLESFDGKFVSGFITPKPEKFKFLPENQPPHDCSSSPFKGLGY